MRDLNEVQLTLFRFFKNNLDIRKQVLNHNLQVLKKDVLRLEKNPYEGRTFHHLDIVAWIDSRIQGKTVGHVIQSRFEDKSTSKT
jgi:hypothetical protein